MGRGGWNRINFSDQEKEKIINEYRSGKSMPEVAKILGVGANTIQGRLEEWGIPRRKKGWQSKTYVFDGSEKERIIARYNNGESPQAISDDYGCHRDTIEKRLRGWGVEMRTNQYNYRHDAFSYRDEEAMYWAGYLMGDGSVGKIGTNMKYWGISLTSSDRSILVKFRKFIGALKKPIYKNKDKSTYTFHFCSEQAKRDLEFFGVLPNKSLTAEIPNDTVLYSEHFWRGLIDADGVVSTTSRGRPMVSFGSGSRDIVEQHIDFLRYHDLYNDCPIYERDDTKSGFYFFVTRCEFAADLARLLYNDASIYLKRKRDKAFSIMNYYNTEKGVIRR